MKTTNVTSQSTKDKILETTGRLMAAKGVKETSLSDIAKEVHISKGTLYYHYASKDDIIYDLADYHLKEITTELMKILADFKIHTGPEKLLTLVFEKIVYAQTRGKLHLYLLAEALMGNDSLKQRFYEKYKEWHKSLEEGLNILFEDQAPSYSLMAQLLLASLDGLLIQKMVGLEPLSLDSVSSIFTKILRE